MKRKVSEQTRGKGNMMSSWSLSPQQKTSPSRPHAKPGTLPCPQAGEALLEGALSGQRCPLRTGQAQQWNRFHTASIVCHLVNISFNFVFKSVLFM